MSELKVEKPPLNCIFRENPKTREGKYLIKRRDGTVAEWPSFVLGARDPAAVWVLRAYAIAGFFYGFNRGFVRSVWRLAKTFVNYRKACGTGDPDRGAHRTDDPATIAEMKKGWSA